MMKRHFVNGMVTEAASANVLQFSCLVVSYVVTILTWAWYDETFEVDTLSTGEGSLPLEVWVFFFGPILLNPSMTIIVLVLLEVFIGAVADSAGITGECASGIYPTELIPVRRRAKPGEERTTETRSE